MSTKNAMSTCEEPPTGYFVDESPNRGDCSARDLGFTVILESGASAGAKWTTAGNIAGLYSDRQFSLQWDNGTEPADADTRSIKNQTLARNQSDFCVNEDLEKK
ncbi:hypothetical protein JOB18_032647 [Solea senegalensis]|uniref:Uncharacterized protein n=1 Tax=Solea senegalensis TaxID=28829 RepID=A0AAV6Q5S3_SOLSE|nr:hypothetical protein JOB18_032647 [Solea senegalensis]